MAHDVRCAAYSRQSGYNADRHLGAGAIQDCLVQCEADCPAEYIDQLAGKINVGILKDGIADAEIAADLVAVNLDLAEAQIELVEVGTHLSPDRLRDLSLNHHPASSGNRADKNMLVQF